MPYPDRLIDASYTSPSGRQISFDFEALSREVSHRIGTFEFSGVNGTLHQDKGVSGELYPMVVFIHGPDYDIQADRFLEISKESGPGFLTHPRWGRRRVQILSITQSENLVQRGGQAVFNVQMQETLEREFPKTGTVTTQAISDLADSWQSFAIDNYVDQVNPGELADQQKLEQDIILSANVADNALSSIVSSAQDVAATFRGYIDNILDNANDYVQEPFEYATQITSAVRVVAEVPGRISSKLQGIKNMLNVINLREVTSAINQVRNSLSIDGLLGMAGIVSVSEMINQALGLTSTISRDSRGRATITVPTADSGFQTRSEVLAAVVYLQENSIELINTLDAGQELFEDSLISDAYIQTVQSYVPSWQVVSAVIKAGLDLSFSLPVKRSIILANSRTILDLSFEFYRNIDDVTLNYLIQTNALTGNDIIEVPRGREVIFYA